VGFFLSSQKLEWSQLKLEIYSLQYSTHLKRKIDMWQVKDMKQQLPHSTTDRVLLLLLLAEKGKAQICEFSDSRGENNEGGRQAGTESYIPILEQMAK
jgi:hypothetical protein